MNDASRKAHWENVYGTKGENEVSWFQESPAPSLELIELAKPASDAAIVDIGGGASRLVDELLARGFSNLTVLDLSEAALAAARVRLGGRAAQVQWVVADVTRWCPTRLFDIWHDRAARSSSAPSRWTARKNAAACRSIGTMPPVSGKYSGAALNWCIRGGMSTRPRGRQSSAFSFPYFVTPLPDADPGGLPAGPSRRVSRALAAAAAHTRWSFFA
jgi:hypothetical protein